MLPCWKNNHLGLLALAAFTLMNPRFHSSAFASIEANVFLRQLLFLDATIVPHGKSSTSSLNRSKIDEDILETKITHKSRSKKLEKKRIKRSKASIKRRKETVSHGGYYQVLWDSTTTVGARTVPSSVRETPTLPAKIVKFSKSATRRAAWSSIQGSS